MALRKALLTALVLSHLFANAQVDSLIDLPLFKVEDAYQIPSTYEVKTVDSVLMKVNQETSITELVKFGTPLFIKEYSPGSLASISNRGTNSGHTIVSWNGIPLNSPMLGQLDLNTVQSSSVDQISLASGASALFAASGGLGGALILSSRQHLKKGKKTVVGVTIGSFGYYNTRFNHGVDLSKKWRSVSRFSYLKTENDYRFVDYSKLDQPTENRNNAAASSFTIDQEFHFTPNHNQQHSLYLNRISSFRELPANILVENSAATQRDEILKAAIVSRFYIGQWKINWVNGAQYNLLNYSDSLSSIYSENIFVNLHSYLKGEWSSKKWKFRGALNTQHEEVITVNYDSNKKRFIHTPTAALTYKVLPSVIVTTGAKLFLLDAEQMLAPTGGVAFTPDDKRISLKAAVAKHYSYPTFNQLYWNPGGNPDLNSEKGLTAELSAEFDLVEREKQNVALEVALFQMNIDNWIQWLPDTAGGSFWAPQNLLEVENRGIESKVSGSMNFSELQLNFSMQHTYTEALRQDLDSRYQLIYVPNHSLKGFGSLNWKKWSLSYQQLYVGSRFISTDNNTYLPDYTVADVYIDYEFRVQDSNIKVGFKTLNVLNEEYHPTSWNPMPGRNFRLNLSVQI